MIDRGVARILRDHRPIVGCGIERRPGGQNGGSAVVQIPADAASGNRVVNGSNVSEAVVVEVSNSERCPIERLIARGALEIPGSCNAAVKAKGEQLQRFIVVHTSVELRRCLDVKTLTDDRSVQTELLFRSYLGSASLNVARSRSCARWRRGEGSS